MKRVLVVIVAILIGASINVLGQGQSTGKRRATATQTPARVTEPQPRQLGGDVHPGQDGMGGTGMIRSRAQNTPSFAPGVTPNSKFKPPAPSSNYDLKNVQVTSVRTKQSPGTSTKQRTKGPGFGDSSGLNGGDMVVGSPRRTTTRPVRGPVRVENDETHTVGHDRTKQPTKAASPRPHRGQPTGVRKPKP